MKLFHGLPSAGNARNSCDLDLSAHCHSGIRMILHFPLLLNVRPPKSCRGDDRWSLSVDAAALDPRIKAIDTPQMEQNPDASGFNHVVVQEKSWSEGDVMGQRPSRRTT